MNTSTIKDAILGGQQPEKLEKTYRSNKNQFKEEFNKFYPELQGNLLAEFWHARLNHEPEEISWGSKNELSFVFLASLIAGIVAKFPAIFGLNEEFFYTRNIGFIVFPFLTVYFAWKNRLAAGSLVFISGASLAALLFINGLPDAKNSDTLILSCMHTIIILWSVLGYAFTGQAGFNAHKRLGFLRYNGDLVVMTALILIAGMIMSGVTVGLFSLIGMQIEKFYFEYVVVFGLAAAPIVATFLTRTNPQLVGKVSPVIARIFCPLVTVMLVIYLAAILYSGKDPYNDRDFLITFNALLIGVMAIIFFSVAESSAATAKASVWVLFILSLLTIIVNAIALSAILFRISEWGMTPNRAAVLGSNLLILVNLLLVTWKLLHAGRGKSEISQVGNVIARYLPVYSIWAVVVTFVFPIIFGFK